MREIKFRVWYNGKFHYWGQFEKGCFMSLPTFGNMGIDWGVENSEQYTGLADINGIEIYEGDILQYKHYYATIKWWSNQEEIKIIEKHTEEQKNNFNIEKSAVKYMNGEYVLSYPLALSDVFKGQYYKSGQTRTCNFEEKFWDFEVIGNIHENEELLK